MSKLVHDVEEVGVGRSQLGEQPSERSGPVGDPYAKQQVPATGDHAVSDDAKHEQWVDIPPGQDRDNRRLE